MYWFLAAVRVADRNLCEEEAVRTAILPENSVDRVAAAIASCPQFRIESIRPI